MQKKQIPKQKKNSFNTKRNRDHYLRMDWDNELHWKRKKRPTAANGE